jgi:hypothetical protein
MRIGMTRPRSSGEGVASRKGCAERSGGFPVLPGDHKGRPCFFYSVPLNKGAAKPGDQLWTVDCGLLTFFSVQNRHGLDVFGVGEHIDPLDRHQLPCRGERLDVPRERIGVA